MRRWSKTGFTLAELLVVVAIIAVLVAVAIPVFSGQLEKSRESTDAANIRSSYAELMAAVISDDKSSPLWKADSSSWKTEPIELRQQKSGWNTASIEETLKAIATVAGTITVPQAGGTAWLEYKGTQLALYYGQGSTEPALTPTQVAEKVLGTELKMENLSQPGKMIVSNKPDLLNDALRAAGFNGSAYITIGSSKDGYANSILGSLYKNGKEPKIVTIHMPRTLSTGNKRPPLIPSDRGWPAP